jgi:PAS domain S-box-containing protein
MKFRFNKSDLSDQPNWWYVDLLDNTPVGIFRMNPEGEMIFCNQTLAEIFGFHSRETLKHQKDFSLFPNKRTLENFLNSPKVQEGIRDHAVLLKKWDGTSFWCTLAMNAFCNSRGMPVFVDGVVKPVEWGLENREVHDNREGVSFREDDLIILLDLFGRVLDINAAGAELLGYGRDILIGSNFKDLISPISRDVFTLFLGDISEKGWEKRPLRIIDRHGTERHLEFQAFCMKKNGSRELIKGIGRDVTDLLDRHKEQLSREKFQGVLEMAGGVAHRMNQPLMIVNNILDELISDLEPADQYYSKIVKVYRQIEKINELSKKIKGIKQYRAIDYVDGVKIVDLDKAS